MTTDQTMPTGPWQFDSEVAAAFDDMLERSIPDYDGMRHTVVEAARHAVAAVTQPARILDLGTSRGHVLSDLINVIGAHGRFLGVDVSEPMLTAARDALGSWMDTGLVEIRYHDLREGIPAGGWTLVTSVLTLMFIPIEYRQTILGQIAETLPAGGSLIIVEKVLASDRHQQERLDSMYRSHKQAAGYSPEAIDRKRLSLEGRLVPVTAAENERQLHAAGFRSVECIWRRLCFAGWVAIR